MKTSGVGILAVLAGVATAGRCRHSTSTLVTSVISSSVPSSSISVSSAISSPVPSRSVLSSSVLSSIIPSSSVLSSSVLSSSVPISSADPTCGGNQCLAAITAEPAIGDVFCSSWLSQTPETTVVTETATVTSTHTNSETTFTVLTLTTATVTELAGTTTLFQKRVVSSISPEIPPAESIFSECSSASARVSSACSCYLSTTSTVTTTETTTETVGVEQTVTATETTTTGVVATTQAQSTQTVPAQPIVNANFEGYLSTGNILPWTNSMSTTGGQFQIINGVNPCASGSVCAGGQVVIRVFPPSNGYTSAKQTFLAKPNTKYAFSLWYRCLNYDANSGIRVLYAGSLIGTANTCVNSAAFTKQTVGTFTTDATGVGEIEVRFMAGPATPYLYYYADAFEATVV